MTSVNWKKLAQDINPCLSHVINGNLIDLDEDKSIDKYSPRDGSLLYRISTGSNKTIDHAVSSAKQAFQDKRWRGMPLHQRQSILNKLADLIEKHQETFALYESLDSGKPITQALGEVMHVSGMLRETVASASKLSSSYQADGAYCAFQLRKPVGVVAAITSWNYPLMLAVIKIAPALVMGNSLILKPSEHASLSTVYLGSLALEAGVPAGVLNIVIGAGSTLGSSLAHHNEVDLLSFTGSSITGKEIQIAAGQSNMKRLLLECGGKSPYLVFDDCPSDLDMLAGDIVGQMFNNQGQNCMASSRLLIHSKIKDKLLPKIVEQTTQLIPQDPLDPQTNFGALVHEAHMEKVLAYIDRGKSEEASLICGGNRIHVNTGTTTEGFYVEPTIFDNVKPHQQITMEEIFGPVLSVLTFNSEQEAIELSNSTSYGLAAYIATENAGRIQRLSQEINSGCIQVVSTSSPVECYQEIGKEGHRESGFGAEGGLVGLISYSLSTAVHHWT